MKVVLCVLALAAVALGAPSAPGGRIFGGINAARGEFPFIVSLQYCIIGFCQHSCGATILSPSWLLTAAHCFTELPGIGSVRVIAGILNQNDANAEKQTINIGRYIVHPNYEGGVNPHDIALIMLSSSLILNAQVQPARLPRQGEEPQGPFDLAGWGSIGGSNLFPQMPNNLQKAVVPLVPIRECDAVLTRILEGRPHPLHFESNVCSGPLDAPITACGGDSGGPLSKGNVVEGVVSWGINPCGGVDAPTVYVKVSNYINWIQRYVDEPLLFAD
ncbi:trypsin-1 [Anoplophora glabripennis]|uniref:trypsin-1 n=1 Tax=Anoplophora glabripennis TaxID=217634 RepID=UPI00087478E9|nr:trypsin-1 [Anoplophora glabripennis]